MTIDIQFVNDARSTLLSDISAAAVSLAVQAGEGALYPSLSGSQYFYITLQNAAGAREIVKCEARAGDTLSTLTRAQEGTSAIAFSAGDKVELRVTEQGLQDKIDQELFDTIAQAAMPTLSKDSPEYIVLTPTGASSLALPTTGVLLGQRFTFINLATDIAKGIRINSSGGFQVSYIPAAQHQSIPVTVMANQDTPTTAGHWDVLVPPKGILFMDEANQTIAVSSDGTSISLPADLLYKNGMGLRIVGAGGAGSGMVAELALTFDGVAVTNYVVGTKSWQLLSKIVRRAADSQVTGSSIIVGIGSNVTGVVDQGTDGAFLTAILVLKLNNLNGADTVEQDLFMVELF